VRILLDYRPALRERTGVGEYVHELTRALAQTPGDSISIFSTSLKDRPAPELRHELAGVEIVDCRWPVRGLTWSWNRLGWPPIEWLAGQVDVVHAQTPLLIPAVRAAQVVTIHDLDFLHHPERTSAEMRRDYPGLVSDHARRADHVIVSSHYAAREVVRHLELAPDRVSVCSPGAPPWAHAVAQERQAATVTRPSYILFIGTIETRKNVRGLIEAYRQLRLREADAPRLLIGGKAGRGADDELRALNDSTLAGQISVLGYVSEPRRRALYSGACLLVLPSLEEGFGLPVLEAMAAGVPVVVSDRGSLPEVVGEAARPVDPADPTAIANEMARLLRPEAAREAIARGLAQAARFSWAACAAAARDAYRSAAAARERRGR
jgi:glycosyltransferase involved in cell wall biosynthesis